MLKPQLVFYAGATLLESPCWHEKKREIFCVSIEQKCIYRINPVSGVVKTYPTKGQVGCVVVEDDGHILAAEESGIYRIGLEDDKREYITQLNTDRRLRYNDGIMDSAGRFLVGTTGRDRLERGKNCLYSWDGIKGKALVSGTTISNGIGFSRNHAYMYFVDTPTRKVGRYAYDLATGDVVFERYIVEITDEGVPDGLCVDRDDMLWVAQWGGAKVSKWDPYTGEKADEIIFPCSNVSSCCIGGLHGDELYVTTAKQEHLRADGQLAGGLFVVKIRG